VGVDGCASSVSTHELERAVADKEGGATGDGTLLGRKGRTEAGTNTPADSTPEDLGDIVRVAGEGVVEHAKRRSASLGNDNVWTKSAKQRPCLGLGLDNTHRCP
jgi:hypothetical protein